MAGNRREDGQSHGLLSLVLRPERDAYRPDGILRQLVEQLEEHRVAAPVQHHDEYAAARVVIRCKHARPLPHSVHGADARRVDRRDVVLGQRTGEALIVAVAGLPVAPEDRRSDIVELDRRGQMPLESQRRHVRKSVLVLVPPSQDDGVVGGRALRTTSEPPRQSSHLREHGDGRLVPLCGPVLLERADLLGVDRRAARG